LALGAVVVWPPLHEILVPPEVLEEVEEVEYLPAAVSVVLAPLA
jgi:hypothetical protein